MIYLMELVNKKFNLFAMIKNIPNVVLNNNNFKNYIEIRNICCRCRRQGEFDLPTSGGRRGMQEWGNRSQRMFCDRIGYLSNQSFYF